MSTGTEGQEMASVLLNNQNDSHKVEALLSKNEALENELKELQETYEQLRIQKSLEDEDLKIAALSTETLSAEKVQKAEEAAASAKKQLVEKQAELAKVHTVVKKMVDQFNILIEGMETAQKNGSFTLPEAHKYWSAISTVKSIFQE